MIGQQAVAFADRLLDLLFPRLRCPFCGGRAGEGRDAGICPTCLAELVTQGAEAHESLAGGAGLVGPHALQGLTCGLHAGQLASAIRRFKYGPQEALGEPLGRMLASRVAMRVAAGLAVDAVVPVPLHPARLRQRGFNQAAVLAGIVARRLALPLRTRHLRRIRATSPQAGLSRSERLSNAADAFAAGPREVRERLLLVDDVLTTGATIQACVETLGGAVTAFATLAAAGVSRHKPPLFSSYSDMS